jgi:hypothetical protein
MDHIELARLGGKARARKLSKKRRRQIASLAGKAGGRGRPKKKRAVKRKAAA